jgi:O-antigen/teichoic acid export membrane protein
LADRAASGAVWVSAQTWGNQIARFAVFLVLARILGPEAFGILTLALVVTALGEGLTVEGGWSKGLIRKPQLDPEDLDSVFWLLMAISGVFVCLAFVLANPVADWFEEPEVARILPWIASVLPLHALNVVPQAILERNFNFRDLALVSLISTLCGGLIGVALALAGAGIWSLVLYQIAQILIRTMLLWRVCRWRPGRRVDWTSLKDILSFATGVLTDRVARAMDFIVGRALIGYHMSTSSLGYYGFAHEFLGLNRRLLVAPLTRVALPAIAGLHFHPERLRAALISGIQYLALVAFPAPIGLAIVAPDLVPLLVGPRWAAAVLAVQIAMLLGPIAPLIRLSVTLQLAVGRARAVAGLAALATTVFLALLLLPKHLTVETVLLALVVRTYLVFPLHLA